MLKNWKLWLGIVISVIFMGWALTGLDLREVGHFMQTANYWWLIPSIIVYFIAVWVRTWRWEYMLRPLKPVSTRKLFPVVVIGYMGNNIYPFRAGEVLRSYVLWKREDVAISASLATVIVERVFDGLVMLIFVFIALPAFPLPPAYRSLVAVASIAFLGALLVFFALAAVPDKALKVTGWFTQFLPQKTQAPILDIAGRFLDGLISLRHFKNVVMIFGTSIIIWLLETVKYWFVMNAFDFGDAQVSFFALMLMNGVVNLATTIPSAPGYVGTFDVPGIAVLMLYGVNQDVATAYTLILHAALWLPITILGAYYMLKEGLRWQDIKKAAQIKEKST